MTMRSRVGCVSITLSLMVFAHAALGQRNDPRIRFSVVPPSPSTLGQQATLAVRPALTGMMYRYVATMTVTGTGKLTTGTACATPQTIGSGSSVSWTPASGGYRVAVHRTSSLIARDSVSVPYQVEAPNGGFLTMTVMQNPNPQPGRLMLTLRTNDRGAGVRYQWVVRFSSAPGTPLHPPVNWSGDSPTHIYSVPFVITPGTYTVTARVGIHDNQPCTIRETSAGMLNNQVIY
jgi:hypothetical protein